MKRTRLALTAVAGFLFGLAGAQPARADHGRDRRDCERKIEREEHKLEREIRKHGWRSHQAERQREKLFYLRRECGFGNGWERYDGRRDRWGRDRNWRDDGDRHRHDPFDCRDRSHRHDLEGYFWRDSRWSHNGDQCRLFDHHHDRDRGGRFRWSGAFWIRIR